MKTYIAMLRGINVSGQKKIKMADLRDHLSELGFDNIRTYIQSGNVLFESTACEEELLAEKIRNMIRIKYGFEVPTIVRSPKEFLYVISNNPFLEDETKEISRMYITFLSDLPAEELVKEISEIDHSPEEFVLDQRIVFGYSPEGYAKAKLSNNFFEKKLKVSATTRNWRTVNKLYEMA